MWQYRCIIEIWFCVVDLSEDLILNSDSRYYIVAELSSFKRLLLQELLLSGLLSQIPSPCGL